MPVRIIEMQHPGETCDFAAPGSRVQFVALPSFGHSSRYHSAVFLRGNRPLTKQWLSPAFVDARTDELTAMRPMPWSMRALQLSRLAHFACGSAVDL